MCCLHVWSPSRPVSELLAHCGCTEYFWSATFWLYDRLVHSWFAWPLLRSQLLRSVPEQREREHFLLPPCAVGLYRLRQGRNDGLRRCSAVLLPRASAPSAPQLATTAPIALAKVRTISVSRPTPAVSAATPKAFAASSTLSAARKC